MAAACVMFYVEINTSIYKQGFVSLCSLIFLGVSLDVHWMVIWVITGRDYDIDHYFYLSKFCQEWSYKEVHSDELSFCITEADDCDVFCSVLEAGKTANGILVSSIVFTIIALFFAVGVVFIAKRGVILLIDLISFGVFGLLSFALTIAGMSVEQPALVDLRVNKYKETDYIKYMDFDGPGFYLALVATIFQFFELVLFYSLILPKRCKT